MQGVLSRGGNNGSPPAEDLLQKKNKRPWQRFRPRLKESQGRDTGQGVPRSVCQLVI